MTIKFLEEVSAPGANCMPGSTGFGDGWLPHLCKSRATSLEPKASGLLVRHNLFYRCSRPSRMSFAAIRDIANETFAV
jgi:hypothetical protein